MKLIFIDEVEQPHKAPGFFGIGALVVDSSFYRGPRDEVDDAFDEALWDRDKEFKGRYLFSSSKGDTTTVSVNARIELVKKIVKGTTAGPECTHPRRTAAGSGPSLRSEARRPERG